MVSSATLVRFGGGDSSSRVGTGGLLRLVPARMGVGEEGKLAMEESEMAGLRRRWSASSTPDTSVVSLLEPSRKYPRRWEAPQKQQASKSDAERLEIFVVKLQLCFFLA